MNETELKEFIKKNSHLFWWIDPEEIENAELPSGYIFERYKRLFKL